MVIQDREWDVNSLAVGGIDGASAIASSFAGVLSQHFRHNLKGEGQDLQRNLYGAVFSSFLLCFFHCYLL